MSQKPIDMNQAKQILQLHTDGVGIKEIVRRTGISRKTVRKYLCTIKLTTHTTDTTMLADSELASVIYTHDSRPSAQQRFESLISHFEDKKDSLHKTGVTRQLLWAEYIGKYRDGYRYSQYCYLFTKYLKDTDPAFHWHYQPAELIQVDFAGKKLSYPGLLEAITAYIQRNQAFSGEEKKYIKCAQKCFADGAMQPLR